MSYFTSIKTEQLLSMVQVGDSDAEYAYMLHCGFTVNGGDRDLSDTFEAYYWDDYTGEILDKLDNRKVSVDLVSVL